MNSKTSLALLLSITLLTSLACQFATDVFESTPTPTLRPPTATVTDTSTPQPTPDRTATAASAATADANVALQTAAPDLNMLGFSVDKVHLAWSNFEDIKLLSKGDGHYYPLDTNLILRDFILGVDVKWDSESGYAGCGIMFHAEEDFERGEQARFNTIRLSGFPGWDIELVKFGQYRGNLSGSVHASSAINQEAGSTNHYVMLSQGSQVTVFANGKRLGAATLTERRYQGQFAFFSFADTGIVSCTFSNGWVVELPHK
jgi:hypothetical protein